jgi:hypothetical protein
MVWMWCRRQLLCTYTAAGGDINRVFELMGRGGIGVNDGDHLAAAAAEGLMLLVDMLTQPGASANQATEDTGSTLLFLASQEARWESQRALF